MIRDPESATRRRSTGRPDPPFEVDRSDRSAPRLSRRTGGIVHIEPINPDAADFLDHLIRAGGLWVTGPQVGRVIGQPALCADRAKAKLPG